MSSHPLLALPTDQDVDTLTYCELFQIVYIVIEDNLVVVLQISLIVKLITMLVDKVHNVSILHWQLGKVSRIILKIVV